MSPDSKVQKKHKVWVTINKHISFPPSCCFSSHFSWSRCVLTETSPGNVSLSPLWLRRALQGLFLFTGQITLTGPVWSINYKPKLIRKHHICNERGTARLALSPSAHLFTLYISPVISSLDNTRFVLRWSTGWLHVHRYRCKHRLPQRVWSVVGAAASGPVFVAVQRAGKDSSDRLIFSWPWNPP